MDVTDMEFREGLLTKQRRPWNTEDVAAIWKRHFERMDTDPAYRERLAKELAADGRSVIGEL